MPNNLNSVLEAIALGTGLARKLNDPDAEKRKMLQEAIARDPTLVQRLQQLSPETLQQAVGKNPRWWNQGASSGLQQSIQNNPVSPEEALRRKKIGVDSVIADKTKNALDQIDNGGLLGNVTATEEQQQIRRSALGIPDPVDQAYKQANTQSLLAGTTDKGQDISKTSRFNENRAKVLNYKGANAKTLIDIYRDPNTPPDIHKALLDTPDLLAQYNKESEEEYRGKVLHIQENNAKDPNEDVAKALAIKAVVSLPTAKFIIDHPEARAKYSDPKYKATTPQDQELFQATQALNEIRDKTGKAALLQASQNFQKEAGPLIAQLRSGKYNAKDEVDNAAKAGILADINRIAKTTFGAYGYNLEYGFGEEGDTSSHLLGDKFRSAVPYVKSADKELNDFGFKVEGNTPKDDPQSDPLVDNVISLLQDQTGKIDPKKLAGFISDTNADQAVKAKVIAKLNQPKKKP